MAENPSLRHPPRLVQVRVPCPFLIPTPRPNFKASSIRDEIRPVSIFSVMAYRSESSCRFWHLSNTYKWDFTELGGQSFLKSPVILAPWHSNRGIIIQARAEYFNGLTNSSATPPSGSVSSLNCLRKSDDRIMINWWSRSALESVTICQLHTLV